MDQPPPNCNICRDLNWDLLERDLSHIPWQRVLKVKFEKISNSVACFICQALKNAVWQFSEPLIAKDPGFAQMLPSKDIRITLSAGYTTTVYVDRTLIVELYSLADNPKTIPAFGVTKEIPPTLELSDCMQFLTANIHACDALHPDCRNDLVQMPSRLLYVGTGGVDCPRLVEGLQTKQPYIALSHCWGDQLSIPTTTKATINERLSGISWNLLPKTFQDAVSITRALNIGYLWIDSLCIIQDDSLDWKAESVKMAEVYSQAFLTISATGAASADFGCLFARSYENGDALQLPHARSQSYSNKVFSAHGIKARYSGRAHRQFSGIVYPPLNGAPLWSRAWVFQERLLSNRTIHFHGEEMIWECQESTTCECGFLAFRANVRTAYGSDVDSSLKSSLSKARNGRTPAQVLATWLELVQKFTSLHITYEIDRLPAISGIASYLSETIQSPYTAGVWEYGVAQGLVWSKFPEQRTRRVECRLERYVPTWSWASVQLLSGTASGLHIVRSRVVTHINFGVVGPDSSDLRIRSFVDVHNGGLRVKGSIITGTLTHWQRNNVVHSPNHELNFRNESQFVFIDISCDHSTIPEASNVVCLLVGVASAMGPMAWNYDEEGTPITTIVQYALVLQQEESGFYTRVGMSELDSRKGWFEDAEVATIEIR